MINGPKIDIREPKFKEDVRCDARIVHKYKIKSGRCENQAIIFYIDIYSSMVWALCSQHEDYLSKDYSVFTWRRWKQISQDEYLVAEILLV
jgi:hypothetical protein